MGKVIRCQECGVRYKTVDRIEELQDNDGVCLQCDAPIEVEDWDRVLASYEDDDVDDVDDEDEEELDEEDELEEDEEERSYGWGEDEPDEDVESFDDADGEDGDDDEEEEFEDEDED